jgi:hypothetical protein
MRKGLGERSDEESEWERPTSESVGIDLTNDVFRSYLLYL